MQSFKDYLESFLENKTERKDHLAWKKDDVKVIKKEDHQNDRKDHLAWNKDDVKVIKKDSRLEEKGPAPSEHHEEHDVDAVHIKPHEHSDSDHHHYAEVHEGLEDRQKKAVRLYKNNSSAFNNFLRHKNGDAHTHLHELKEVTRHKTPSDMHGFRSFGNSFPIHNLKKGDIVHDKGFTGVSSSYQIAKGFGEPHEDEKGDFHYHIAKIHIPKGTKAHFLDNKASKEDGREHFYAERETLLHPGTKFKVTGHSVAKIKDRHTKTTRYHHIVHMTVHDQED